MRKIKDGYIKVDDIHEVYYVEYGDPNGQPVLMFHGGPGSRFKKTYANGKDKFRVIAFDQRGCGKSKPRGEIKANNTQNLLSDVDKILDKLGIDKVIVMGASWGSTMALLYAQHNPKRVSNIFVAAVFLGRKKDDEWILKHSQTIYPDYYDKFISNIPVDKRDDISVYLFDRIQNGDFKEKKKVAEVMSNYEYALMLNEPDKFDFVEDADEETIGDTKIYLHFMVNECFLNEKNGIMNNLDKIGHIPTVIVQGRVDMCCPLIQAYELHKGLKNSELIIVNRENHKSKKVSLILTDKLNGLRLLHH